MTFGFISNRKVRLFVAKNAPKWFRSPIYKILYRACAHEFFLSKVEFSGKRILIIGPARTGPMELSDLNVDCFDIVVKMNNGIFTPVHALKNENRCNILFHSLTSDTKPVPTAQIEKCGVSKIVHRLPKRSAFLRMLIEEERYKAVAEMKILPYEDYQNLSAKLNGYSPSTGLACASFFLGSNAAEVAIVGFTFFSTSYVPGYDLSVESDEASRNRVERAGHHSPQHEARLMGNLIEQAQERGVHVVVGSEMRNAMLRTETQAGP
jgi:hypothetical protein